MGNAVTVIWVRSRRARFYATAPEAPRSEGFSIGRLIEEVRREIRGNARRPRFDDQRHPIETRRQRDSASKRGSAGHDSGETGRTYSAS